MKGGQYFSDLKRDDEQSVVSTEETTEESDNDCKMLKRFSVWCAILAVLSILLCAWHTHKSASVKDTIIYARTAITTTIDVRRGLVGFTDMVGVERYWWCDTAEAPWSLNDEVLLVLNNEGTQWMYDDTIVSITTEGIITQTVSK